MKTIALLFALLVSTVAQAQANAPITSSYAATLHRYTNAGEMVVCPIYLGYTYRDSNDSCVSPRGVVGWLRLKDAVPPGKTYTGYTMHVVGGGSTVRTVVEIFWK